VLAFGDAGKSRASSFRMWQYTLQNSNTKIEYTSKLIAFVFCNFFVLCSIIRLVKFCTATRKRIKLANPNVTIIILILIACGVIMLCFYVDFLVGMSLSLSGFT